MIPTASYFAILRSCMKTLEYTGTHCPTRYCVMKTTNLRPDKVFHNIKYFSRSQSEKDSHTGEKRPSSKDLQCADKKSNDNLKGKNSPTDEALKNTYCEATAHVDKEAIAEACKVICATVEKDLTSATREKDLTSATRERDLTSRKTKKSRKEEARQVQYAYSLMDKMPQQIPWEHQYDSKSQNMHLGAGIIVMAISTLVMCMVFKP